MKTVPTVYELRQRGWKVKVGHHRNIYKYNTKTGKKTGKEHVLLSEWKENYTDMYLAAKGGKTVVSIRVPDIDFEFVGETYCSEDEKYSKSIGLKKALARALSVLNKRING